MNDSAGRTAPPPRVEPQFFLSRRWNPAVPADRRSIGHRTRMRKDDCGCIQRARDSLSLAVDSICFTASAMYRLRSSSTPPGPVPFVAPHHGHSQGSTASLRKSTTSRVPQLGQWWCHSTLSLIMSFHRPLAPDEPFMPEISPSPAVVRMVLVLRPSLRPPAESRRGYRSWHRPVGRRRFPPARP